MNVSNFKYKSMKKNLIPVYWDRGKCGLRTGGMHLLCLFCFLGLSLGVRAQQNKLTYSWEKAKLPEVLKTLEKADVYKFMFNYNDVDYEVSAKVKDKTVLEILDIILQDKPLTYKRNGIYVMIRLKDAQPGLNQYLVNGRVTDAKGVPLPGVTVRLENTAAGTATDPDGNFSMTVHEEVGHMTFSFVGFETVSVQYVSGQPLNVRLKETSSDLDEVTVVAYGERKKRELISSVSSVKAKDLEEVPSASIENLLQGHMAGVEITNVSGSPGGGGTRVNIRGYNSLLIDGINDGSPLYVVDGVPINAFTSPVTGTNTLAEIDPQTIESVEVLKDAASAAIYGSRASNGVILITTKQGKVGKGKFSANVSYSYSILPETPFQISGNGERRWLLNAARNQRLAYGVYDPVLQIWSYQLPNSHLDSYGTNGAYDYFWNNGQIKDYGGETTKVVRPIQDSLNPFYNNSTNWWKQTFQPGKILNANLQASGGTERVKYMVGAGWYQEKGIMIGSDFERVNLISNLNITPHKDLQLDARISLSYTDRSRGAANTSFGSGHKIESMTVNPTQTSTLLPGSGEVLNDFLLALNESSEKNISFNLRTNIGLTYTITKGLSLHATLGADYNYDKKNSFSPSMLDGYDGLSVSTGEMIGNMSLQNEELLNYNFSIKQQHNFDLLAGFSYTRKSLDRMAGSGKGSPSDKIHYVPDGFDDLKDIHGTVTALQRYLSNFEEQKMVGIFGRVAYNFRQKYLTEVTFRRDGSSTFGDNVRWANFPSVAVGWAFSEENALKDLWWLSYGKIRVSWGMSGQTFADSYLAKGTLGIGSSFLGNTGMITTAMLNENLTWEKSDQYDIGLDVDLLDYRLKFKLDYYYKYSKSLLFRTTMPGNVYFHDDAWQNAMAISNEGLELEANFDILRESAVSWRARFNISRNWNKIEKTYTGMDIVTTGSQYILGRPLSGLYVYKSEGMIQSQDQVLVYYQQDGSGRYLNCGVDAPFGPGMKLIADLNGDGTIDQDDQYYAGSALPLAYGGFANEVKWKGFDLNVLFTYSLGRKLINVPKHTSLAFDGRWSPVFTDYRDMEFWEKPGDNGMPTLGAVSNYYIGQFTGLTDDMIEQVSWLRLKQLTLGYNVPKSVLKKIGFQGVRVFFTAENLFILSNYSGLDPEAVDQMEPYDNLNNYPLARKLTLGLTLNF